MIMQPRTQASSFRVTRGGLEPNIPDKLDPKSPSSTGNEAAAGGRSAPRPVRIFFNLYFCFPISDHVIDVTLENFRPRMQLH